MHTKVSPYLQTYYLKRRVWRVKILSKLDRQPSSLMARY
jgi:hypothetical protein